MIEYFRKICQVNNSKQTSDTNGQTVKYNDDNINVTTNLNQMMENGNYPSTMEVLDEIVGHNFNLQETGLDGSTPQEHHQVTSNIDSSNDNREKSYASAT
jgi:hypothetical protein